MKFGLRKPSIRKSIAARTSAKRFVRHNLGFKAPRGMGWITNPKKAAYNRAYNRKTFSLGKGGKGAEGFILLLLIYVLIGTLYIAWKLVVLLCKATIKLVVHLKKNGPSLTVFKPLDQNSLRVKIVYQDARGAITERTICINNYEVKNYNTIIYAFCEEKNEERVFLLHRILEVYDPETGKQIHNLYELLYQSDMNLNGFKKLGS